MCYSAAISFELASILAPIGALSFYTAFIRNKRFLLFASIPLFFAMQQFFEGIIWIQLATNDVVEKYYYAYFYLFFAYAFWPVYVPLSIYLIEKDRWRIWLLRLFLLSGFVVASMLYYPVFFGEVPFKVTIRHHSIVYVIYESMTLMQIYAVIYAAAVILPFLISSWPRVKLFGLLALAGLMISYSWHYYAFTSIWCFFAAFLSIYIAFSMYKLPRH